MNRAGHQAGVCKFLDPVVEFAIYFQVVQIVLPLKTIFHCNRGSAYAARPDIEGLHPVVGAVLFDHQHSLQSHQNMRVRLHVTMVERGTRLPRLQPVCPCLAGHGRMFTEYWYAVVAFAGRRLKRMIGAVKMNRVWQVMPVFQREVHGVALLDTDYRRRQAYHAVDFGRLEICRRHTPCFRRENPQSRGNAGCDLEFRHDARVVGRLPVQFHQLEPDTNDVRIAIAVQVVVLLDRVERQ